MSIGYRQRFAGITRIGHNERATYLSQLPIFPILHGRAALVHCVTESKLFVVLVEEREMLKLTDENRVILLSLCGVDSVCAIGEFNNWSTVATPLREIRPNEWELRLPSDANLERLGLFVIGKGMRSGHVIELAELIYSRSSDRSTLCAKPNPQASSNYAQPLKLSRIERNAGQM